MRSVGPCDEWFEGAISLQVDGESIKPWRLWHEKLALFPDEGFRAKAECPAGVRVRVRTDSPRVGLRVEEGPEARLFDLVRGGERLETAVLPAGETDVVFPSPAGGDETLEIWLANTHPVAVRGLLIEEGARVEPAADSRVRWITYGSSITQCAAAHSPSRTWPGLAARQRNLHLTCLGYGGQCHLDGLVARMIRERPAAFISLKLGINMHGGSVSPRTFREMILSFVATIRDAHPEVPIALISPIISPPREETPGATGYTVRMMREHVEDAANRLVRAGDTNVHYFSGLDLLGEEHAADRLPDELHPDGEGYEILGRNFVRVVLDGLGISG